MTNLDDWVAELMVNPFPLNTAMVKTPSLPPTFGRKSNAWNGSSSKAARIAQGSLNRPNRIRFMLQKAETATTIDDSEVTEGRHKLENRCAASFPASSSEPAL